MTGSKGPRLVLDLVVLQRDVPSKSSNSVVSLLLFK